MALLYDRVRVNTATTGTGPITLGSAVTGYRSFSDASIPNATVVSYVIEDGSAWEVGSGTYTSAGGTLSRTVTASSNSNTAISLSGFATLALTALAADIRNNATMPSVTVDNTVPRFDGTAGNIQTSTVAISDTGGLTGIASYNGGGVHEFRNKIINGDFWFWQRAQSQTSNGYGSDDRWFNTNVGSTKTVSIQAHTLGQTTIPGNPVFFSRTVVTSVAGASNYVRKSQRIEFVTTLENKQMTLTFWAKADASKNMAVELLQSFGTGGSPSADATFHTQLCALTTSWQRFDIVVNVPSVAGKTKGSSGGDNLQIGFWYDAGSTYASRSASLGQQSGTFDISHVSVVEGDASDEADPFAARHYGIEYLMCQRYYCVTSGNVRFPATAGTQYQNVSVYFPATMRTATPTLSLAGGASNLVSSTLIHNTSQWCARLEVISSGAGDVYRLGVEIRADAEL